MDNSNSRFNPALVCTILITLTGWGVTFGVCQQKIENNTRDIERLEKTHAEDLTRTQSRQDLTDNLLQSINTQLVELNTKVELILKGQIKTE